MYVGVAGARRRRAGGAGDEYEYSLVGMRGEMHVGFTALANLRVDDQFSGQ